MQFNENTAIYYAFEGLGHQNFHSKINKKRDCNPNVILDCSNQRKSEKVLQKGFQWETHWKFILVPSECTLAPNDHQNTEKVMSQDPECLKHGSPRPPKISKSVKRNEWNLLEKMYAIADFSNDFHPANLWKPSSLQINSQLVARGAGGRDEALRFAPTPQGGRACQSVAQRSRSILLFFYSSGSQEPQPLAPAPAN